LQNANQAVAVGRWPDLHSSSNKLQMKHCERIEVI